MIKEINYILYGTYLKYKTSNPSNKYFVKYTDTTLINLIVRLCNEHTTRNYDSTYITGSIQIHKYDNHKIHCVIKPDINFERELFAALKLYESCGFVLQYMLSLPNVLVNKINYFTDSQHDDEYTLYALGNVLGINTQYLINMDPCFLLWIRRNTRLPKYVFNMIFK